jgi:transposase
LRHVNLHAAGIDIGAESHWVAVPEGCDPQGRSVREFGAFTADLYAVADWLATCGITTVAMESTGVYWIPLFEILDERGFAVALVNPHHVKNVPGRKSDVLDCQWLQQLHTYGLLRGSFRPEDQICVLRAYLRQRAMLIRCASQHVQHMQKALDQMNLKLHRVVSDLTGVTGMRIIRALLAGERDPVQLAQRRHPRCQSSSETIAKALAGNWREEHLFSLRQAVALYDAYHEQIAACDAQIEAHFATFATRTDDPPPSGPGRTAKRVGNDIGFDAKSHLYRITGVDLTRIPGIDTHTALKLISEIGLDMTRWPSVKHFTSWLGLCPGSKISGGKVLSSRTKPTANRAATAFRLAAHGLHHSHSALGAFLRRKKAHLGSPKAITATAHKLARMVYTMLRHGSPYQDPGEDDYESRYRTRVVSTLKRKAAALGYSLIEINTIDPKPCPAAPG